MTGWLSDNLVSILNGVALGCLLFALAVGLSLVFGVLDVLNLAHGSLFVAGAYAAWRLADDGSLAGFGLAVLLAAAIGGAGGLALTVATRPLTGRSHLDQALLTLGIALVVTEVVQSWFGRDPHGVLPPLAGSAGIGGGYPIYRLALIAVGVALAFAVDRAVERTRAGALVRAGATNAPMVAALCVDIRRLFMLVFGFGAMLAGFAGVMAAPILSVEPGMGDTVLILAFVVIVIGGIGSIRGAFLAALLIGLVDTVGRSFAPNLLRLVLDPAAASQTGRAIAPMLIYIFMAAVLFFRPSGLFPVKR
jgi:branched-chain amino acid transport system permease protein